MTLCDYQINVQIISICFAQLFQDILQSRNATLAVSLLPVGVSLLLFQMLQLFTNVFNDVHRLVKIEFKAMIPKPMLLSLSEFRFVHFKKVIFMGDKNGFTRIVLAIIQALFHQISGKVFDEKNKLVVQVLSCLNIAHDVNMQQFLFGASIKD